MNGEYRRRALTAVRDVLPRTYKTCLWIVEMTVGVSLLILFLRYFNILPWISSALAPVFSYVGLPGEAALAYVSGFFVNVYSAIAVAVTLDLDSRSFTILAIMVLCSHSMIVETAVQKKTGTSAILIIVVRTLSGIILASTLNLILPGQKVAEAETRAFIENLVFGEMFIEWLRSAFWLTVKITAIVFALNILQSLLAEFGVIRYISKFLRPLLAIFGLPARCSFLWIVANVVGLAYGAAAMIDETHKGKLSKRDIDLTNIHISISHSNLEDLILFSSAGAIWWVLLLSRWIMSILLVWGYRLVLVLRNKK